MTPLLGGSIVVFLLGIWFLRHVIGKTTNDLAWEQLISTRAVDGKSYVDWNKIGQGMGVVCAVWLPFIYANSEKMDGTGLALVMAASFLYLGGVSTYATSGRARRDERIEAEK
jgi:hypothetical protein